MDLRRGKSEAPEPRVSIFRGIQLDLSGSLEVSKLMDCAEPID